jgi:putative ABC transport system substrate-binding protein
MAATVCYASLSISYYDLGVETGKMAAQVLMEKKAISDIEIMTLTPTVTYNEELCASAWASKVPVN